MASRSWNRVELIGNLTRDPEMRYTPTGTAVTSFSIATNRVYTTPDGEKKEEVDFHRIVAWGKLAELCSQLLKKGNRVFVSGRLQNREWEGQDGQKRQTTEIVIEDMIILSPKNGMGEEYTEDVSPPPQRPMKPPTPPQAEAKDEKAAEKEEEKKESPKPEKEDPGDLEDLPF